MSSKALEQGGKHDVHTLSTRLTATRQLLTQKVRTAGLLFPLMTLAGTAVFWSIVWLLDTAPVHALSPVNALLRIYGTGIAVVATMVIVGASVWLIVKRLGYADRLTEVLFEHADDIGPVPAVSGSLARSTTAPAAGSGLTLAALPSATPRLQLEAARNDDGERLVYALAAPVAQAKATPSALAAAAPEQRVRTPAAPRRRCGQPQAAAGESRTAAPPGSSRCRPPGSRRCQPPGQWCYVPGCRTRPEPARYRRHARTEPRSTCRRSPAA